MSSRTTPNQANIRELFQQGVEYTRRRKYKKALECFDEILESEPHRVNAWYNRGVVLHQLRKYQAAIESYDKALGLAPARHLVMIRAFRTATLVVSIAPIEREVAQAAREFSKARGFDLVYLPGMEREESNRYNVLPEPVLYDAMYALLGEARDAYVEAYDFHIEPVDDDRPFLYHALRLETLTTLWRQARAGGTRARVEGTTSGSALTRGAHRKFSTRIRGL